MGATGFDLLAQAGVQNGREQAQRKRQLSDEEREQALADHNNTIGALQKKMTAAQTAGDTQGYQTLQSQLNQVVSDRTALFHPDQGPNAMAHLGKMVWEHVHGKPAPTTQATTPEFQLPGNSGTMGQPGPTVPATTGPVVTQRPQTAGDLKERAATDLGFGAAAPAANPLLQHRQQLTAAGFTPEQVDKAMGIFAGIEAKPVAEKPDTWTPYGKPVQGEDGKWSQPFKNRNGEIENRPTPEGYTPPAPAAKLSQSAAAVQSREYAKAKYGDENHALTFEDEQNKIRLIKQAGAGTNVSNQIRFVQQMDGTLKAEKVQQTSGKSYGGVQPTAPGSSQPSAAAPKEAGATTPTPGTLKKNAAAIAASSKKKSAAGVVQAGDTVGGRATPEQHAAAKARDAAKDSYSDVVKSSRDPSALGDKGIVLAWLRGRVNRVTATEIASVNNLGGAVMKLEGNIARIESGQMSDRQRKWFLQSAKDNLDTKQEILDQYTHPDGGPSVDELVNALNKGK